MGLLAPIWVPKQPPPPRVYETSEEATSPSRGFEGRLARRLTRLIGSARAPG